MLRLILRDATANAPRYLLSILAVVLGVSFVSGTFALRAMLSDTFTSLVEDTAPADVYVQGADPLPGGSTTWGQEDARVQLPLDLAERIEAEVEGVDLALPSLLGEIVLVGSDGTAVRTSQAPSLGIGMIEDDPALELTAGRFPRSADEIALESSTSERAGLSAGEVTTVVLEGEVREVAVTGVVSMGTSMAGAAVVLLPMETAVSSYAPDRTVQSIGIYASDGVDPETLVARIEAADLDTGSVALEVITGDDSRADALESIDSQLGFITTFLLVFALVALFVGAFIIANTFAMAVRRQVRQFALLRAIGTSPAQVFGVVIGQAVVVGAIGSLLGVAGGVGLVALLRLGFAQMGMDLSGRIPLETSTVIICVCLGVLVSVVAALVPARQAALVAPVEAMRGEVRVPQRSLRLRAMVGSLVLAAGTTAVAIATARPAHDDSEGLLAVGAIGVLLGSLVVISPLVRSAMWLLGAPVAALVRPLGKLARGNLVRNPRRTGSTAGALMIGMALVGGAAVIASSAQASVRGIVEAVTDSDLVVTAVGSMVPAGAIDDLRALPETGTVDTLPFSMAAISDSAGEEPDPGSQGAVAGADPRIFDRAIRVELLSGVLEELGPGTVAVNERMAGQGWEVGDELTIVTASARQTLTVVAVVTSNAIGSTTLVHPEVLDELVPQGEQLYDIALIDAADGVSPEHLREAVTETVAPYVVLSVQDRGEWIDDFAAQVDQILVILYALLGLSLAIAVLGIVNTQALSVLERTREIGLLRAVGLGRLQLAGTVTIESVLTAAFGALLGLAIGVALAATLPSVYEDAGLTELVVPWTTLAGMAGIALLAGGIAALWPAIRAARMRTLEAIATE